MKKLPREEMSVETVTAFTETTQDNKHWLLVSPLGDMWSAADPEHFKFIYKEGIIDVTDNHKLSGSPEGA